MKRTGLFILANVALVLVVGLIVGLTIVSKETGFTGRVLGFILLLITLCSPTIIFLAKQPMNSPLNVGSLLFTVTNVVANSVFMALSPELNVIAIAEAIIIGVYIVFLMIVIALSSKGKKE